MILKTRSVAIASAALALLALGLVIGQWARRLAVAPPLLPTEVDATTASGTPTKPRYELADPALESLSTGQKMLLRVGPAQAARLKTKLRALRAGLIQLGH